MRRRRDGGAGDGGQPVARLAVAALAAACVCRTARAGPPFQTDDPVPVDLGHWEIDNFSSGTVVRGDAAGAAAAVDANYGAFASVQLHVVVPIAFNSQRVTGARLGYGDAAAGAKWRVFNPDPGSPLPQVAVYPTVFAPTGDAARGLGTGRWHAFLPVWLEWDFGRWTTYGGVGRQINPGPGNLDSWFAGWLVERHLTETLAVAAEVFRSTASTAGGRFSVGFPLGSRPTTGFNVGGVYDFSDNYHLLLSAGRGVENTAVGDRFSWYAGFQITF